LGSYFVSTDVYLTKGEFYSLEVSFSKKLGASIIRLLWESDSLSLQVIPESALFNQLNAAQTPYFFTVVPASTSAHESRISDLTQVLTATVNVAENHRIVARDTHRNLKQDQLDLFEVTLTKNDDQSI